ncbi:hypothetical protein [Tateyamaria pelophila]|uniref:hypothetical protein n=1 Tax=Tateyamaria pelophila TaxID=328415 RepID=UPI001CBAECDB|nr:hypothetical protein [Tateyamaria pelophila]
MKPNFALSLSFDGIRLLLRAAGGWQVLGEVEVADPNLASALAALRISAQAYKPEDIRSKLIIPDEQIRYLSTETGPLSDAERRTAARHALEGATPYAVDDLVFDISVEGDTTHIAAVARETLTEVEAFATEHAFNPVSFVAAPNDAAFLGEPFFGTTEQSKVLLEDGETVEPDGVRVVVVGDAPPPLPPEEEMEDAPDESIIQKLDTATEAGPHQSNTATEAESSSVTQSAPLPPAAAEPEEMPDAEQVEDAPILDTAPPEDVHVPPKAAPKPPSSPVVTDQGGAARPTDAPREPDPADTASEPDKSDGPHEPRVAPVSAGPATAGGAALGFASRRSANARPKAPLGGVTRKAPSVVPTKPTSVSAPPPPSVPPKATVESLRQIEPPVLPSEPVPAPEPKDAKADEFLSRRKAPQASGTSVTKSAKSETTLSAEKIEAQRMTIFGARDSVQVGGKPRYLGLILTAALLIFLAGVAAWASVFLDDGLARLFQGRERTLASTLPEETQSVLANDVGATTDAPDEAAADALELASLNAALSDGLTSEDAAVLDALRDPRPDPAEDMPETLDGAALEARYAVTGIWPKAPDSFEPAPLIPLEDLYVTSIDPISPALDAVALPSALSFETDRQLAVVTSPVAAGTNFAMGTDGRVIATVDGAMSPDGHLVFLGPPPLVPPATPVRFATDPTETGTLQTATQVRPRARPTDLIEQNERATLGGLSRSELAGLRPRLRPQALQQQEEEQQKATAPDDAPPSALATTQSLRPKPRPSDFSRLVARATPSSASTAAVATAPAPTSVAPRSVTPSIPSSASVSREATTRNAINLRQVNLIGVYGKPSDRRALIRLSNGRYQKVQVGDRLDGGRVSAIGDSELRYQKGSRNVVLKMPKG